MKLIYTVIFVALIGLLAACQPQSNVTEPEAENQKVESVEEQSGLTPEEVIARMDQADGVGVEQGPISVEIISPTEPTFEPSQARLYKAAIDGVAKGRNCSCDWKFYLNQYDQEAPYQQMGDRQCTPQEDGQYVCAFTSTFIKDRGDLQVLVEVEVGDRQGEVVQTGSAEKTYRVQ